MAQSQHMTGTGKFVLALGAAASIAIAVPTAGLALGGTESLLARDNSEFALFTPSTVDPELAARVAESIRTKGLGLQFTPAGTAAGRDRTMTVAVRVDDRTARAISVRSAGKIAQAQPGIGTIAIAPTRYNLGVARGYQSFTKTPTLPTNVRSVEMPDLAAFKPSRGVAADKPDRFQPRIALENEENVGRSPRTFNAQGEQSVDFGGAYRVTKNLDVTAGVRLSQERDRLDPLTDNVQDSQAVYVGTQFRF